MPGWAEAIPQLGCPPCSTGEMARPQGWAATEGCLVDQTWSNLVRLVHSYEICPDGHPTWLIHYQHVLNCFDCILDPIRNLINLGFVELWGPRLQFAAKPHQHTMRKAGKAVHTELMPMSGIHDMPRFAWDIATNPSLLCYSPCSGDFWVVSCFLGMPFYAHLGTAQNIWKLYPQEMDGVWRI